MGKRKKGPDFRVSVFCLADFPAGLRLFKIWASPLDLYCPARRTKASRTAADSLPEAMQSPWAVVCVAFSCGCSRYWVQNFVRTICKFSNPCIGWKSLWYTLDSSPIEQPFHINTAHDVWPTMPTATLHVRNHLYCNTSRSCFILDWLSVCL